LQGSWLVAFGAQSVVVPELVVFVPLWVVLVPCGGAGVPVLGVVVPALVGVTTEVDFTVVALTGFTLVGLVVVKFVAFALIGIPPTMSSSLKQKAKIAIKTKAINVYLKILPIIVNFLALASG
jgi:hypothetical protein